MIRVRTAPPLDYRVVWCMPVNVYWLSYRSITGMPYPVILEKLKVMPYALTLISDSGCEPAQRIHL